MRCLQRLSFAVGPRPRSVVSRLQPPSEASGPAIAERDGPHATGEHARFRTQPLTVASPPTIAGREVAPTTAECGEPTAIAQRVVAPTPAWRGEPAHNRRVVWWPPAPS